MDILITICARGGSKGVPRKNIKLIDGLPLIAYSIKHAQEFARRHNAYICLSTEDEEIKDVAKQFGLISDYSRPLFLADDSIGKIAVISDVYNYVRRKTGRVFDLVLDLDVSSPLRNQSDLDLALNMLMKQPQAINLFSVSESRKNPYFNMVEMDNDGFVEISKKFDTIFYSRQASPKVYEINGSFYFYKKSFFESGFSSAVVDHRSLAFPMDHLCLDVDSSLDFEYLQFLIQNKKLDFEFLY